MNGLNSLGWQLHDHLKKYRPQQFRQLEASGQLLPFVKQLQDRANDELSSLEQNGLRPDEAWEIVKDHVLLPAEPNAV